MQDNERYKVVWSVLNALRAHDDRFNATVNKIELNKERPGDIMVGRPETGFGKDTPEVRDGEEPYQGNKDLEQQLALQFEDLQDVVYARMVEKVGDRRYWEQWAKDVADIAERQIDRINNLIEDQSKHREAFNKFLNGLRDNINPSITKDQAVDMLGQHIITRPIFEALFEDYSFIENNVVSSAMQNMLDTLQGQTLEDESEKLNKFYDSVRKRAEGIDNAEGKQRIINELYDKFFKTAFPDLVEQLGIVYTPVEVVDFIIHSINDVLEKEFGRTLSDENIHILDPFTGTGTFVTRLLQSGLINSDDLERKYNDELHANEIVLLAYYIAAVNIENEYHDQLEKSDQYEPFDGIVLTDTFQLGETEKDGDLFSDIFPQNLERAEKQRNAPLRVIMGNPPYSIGQSSANDLTQNQSYPELEERIEETYAEASTAGLSKSLYDSYVKAFRWSTDRLDPENGGVIGFVSNGGWLNATSMDGFRKTIENEFSSIWVFDLRGNARTQGELRRKEAGNVFGGGSRTPIAITLLVKNPQENSSKATIHYHDIGDYLDREEKLSIISKYQSIDDPEMEWDKIKPNKHGDWLEKRSELFESFIPMAPKKKSEMYNLESKHFFTLRGPAVSTNRDAWVYSFSKDKLERNMKRFIQFYNDQVDDFQEENSRCSDLEVDEFIDTDPTKIKWSAKLKRHLNSGKKYHYQKSTIVRSLYRPFTKQFLYYHKPFIERPGISSEFFPSSDIDNLLICVSGKGANRPFSTLITDSITCLDTLEKNQCFPLYYFEKHGGDETSLFEEEYVRRDGISNFILEKTHDAYGKDVTKEDIFYYVYGILHSDDYRTMFANDLKKMLPRIPLIEDTQDFWGFSEAGRELAELHLNYEDIEPFDGVKVTGVEEGNFKVEKMRFAKSKKRVNGKKKTVEDKSTIKYNSQITVSNIPEKAYEYEISGKSAIEWIMDRYQVSVDKRGGSGIKNDPNDWPEEVNNPRYVLDLLLSVINVSVQTVDIVDQLPELTIEDLKK